MPSRYELPHIDISARSVAHEYEGDPAFVRGTPRDRIEHGQRVQNELRVAMAAAEKLRPTDARLPPPGGIYLEVELDRGTMPDALDLKKQGIRTGAAKVDDA